MTMQDPTLPIQQLQQSQTYILMFGPLKEAMGGKEFRYDEEVRHAVHEWLCGLPKEFFSKGIYALALSVGEIMF